MIIHNKFKMFKDTYITFSDGESPLCNIYPALKVMRRCEAPLKFLQASKLHEPAPNTEMLQILFNSRTMCG